MEPSASQKPERRRAAPKQHQSLKIQRQLITFAYWHVFLTSWLHRHPSTKAKRGYLLVDDFHREIYDRLGVSWKATSGYVKDMIGAGFLERLDRKNGVPHGTFAVRMPESAFVHFAKSFSAAAPAFGESARELLVLFNQSREAIVVPFATDDKENVSATSPKKGDQSSGIVVASDASRKA